MVKFDLLSPSMKKPDLHPWLCPYSYRYVSRMTRTKSFLSQNIFIVFLETTFLHVSCYLVHCEQKIFFGFSKSATTPRYTILDTRLPFVLCYLGRQASLSNTSTEMGVLPLRVRIENDSDRKLSKSKLFYSFLETTFLHVSCYPVHCEPIFFSVFRSRHLSLDTQFWTRGFPLVMQSRKAGLPFATRAWKRVFCP